MLNQNWAVSSPVADPVLAGGGEMGALMRSLDWAQTALGPVETWPQSLKTSVSTCLNSRFAILIWWGRELVMLYNDAYVPILGDKHPHALGAPGKQVWPEIWHIIGPMLEGVLARGEATWSDNLLLELERNGYQEECYFTFSYSPIRDESGGVGGVFTPVQETTAQVIGERRLETLRELAEGARAAVYAPTMEQVSTIVSATLTKNPYDVPFSAFYLLSEDGKSARLASTSGVDSAMALLPNVVSLNEGDWPFAKAASGDTPQVVTIPEGWGTIPRGAWPIPPREVMVLPILPAGQRAGFLILAISPRKRLDEDYRRFLLLVAGNITTAVLEVRAFAEERKRAEALAEMDRVKTQFFSNVSHEFRTPLTLILGPLEDTLALDTKLPAKLQEAVMTAHRNSLRLLRLVNSLLDFSRIEAGRLKAAYEPTDLSSFTAELASNFRAAAERAGLAFSVDCPPLPEPVYVDHEMWEKVVLNLLSNAFKFTFAGGIAVRLRTVDNHAEFSVTDTGTGIPERELPHLFERFHRVKETRGRTYEGTGIGLALVQELVRLHGGTVRVESALGKGSVFIVAIPLGRAHLPSENLIDGQSRATSVVRADAFVEEALRWLPEELASPGDSSQPENRDAPALSFRHQPGAAEERACVLIVDDNADMRDYVGRLLSRHYRILTASNGDEALPIALQEKPDLILSDIMMPGLDGFGLLQALRSHPNTRSVPVILLSARAGEEARSEGMEADADDYLVKPFSARELLARVGAHLRLARARKAADERAALILESITDSFLALDGQWQIVYVNRAAERLTGSSREELLGKNQWEAFDVLRGTIVEQECRRAMRDRVPVEFEVPFDRVQRWFSINAYPTQDGGLALYCREITEQKRAALALRESEERFRELADNISQFAWIADPTGSVSWYNQRWYDYTGTTFETMQGLGWQKVLHPEHIERVAERFRASIQSGEVWEDTYPLLGANGEWRWFLSRARPIRDNNGVIVRWFGTNTDVTEQREAEQRLRAAVVDLPFPLMLHAEDGEILALSRAWTELTGYTRQELKTHQDWVRLAYPGRQLEIEAQLRREFASNEITRFGAIQVRTKSGQGRIWDFQAVPLGQLQDGRRIQMSAATDVTERIYAEEALRTTQGKLALIASASRSLLSTPVSHEVLPSLLVLAQELIAADAYALWRKGSDDQGWELVASQGISENYSRQASESSVALAMLSDIVVFEDLLAHQSLSQRWEGYRQEGLRAMMSVPLRVQRETTGAIVFYHRRVHSFSEAERTIAAALSHLASAALTTAELYDKQAALLRESEAAESRARLLADAGAALASSLDYEETLRAVAKLSVPAFADWSAVDLVTASGELQRVAIEHIDPARVDLAEKYRRQYPPREDEAAMTALRTGQSFYMREITDAMVSLWASDDAHALILKQIGLRSLIVVPMKARDRVLGVLTFAMSESNRRYDAADLILAEELARRAAAAIDNAQLYAEMRESEERFRAMADSAPVFIWVSDTTKARTWFNRAWLEFTGRTLDQKLGYGWTENVHPEDLQRCLGVYHNAFERREPFTIDYRLRRRDGEWRWITVQSIPRRNGDGTFAGYIGSCIDITERKQVEEGLRKANDELEEFAYVASHDLQEPLRMVNIYTQLLLRRNMKNDPGAQHYGEFIQQGVTRMEELIRDLLSYSRIIHTDGPAVGTADLSEALSQALEMLKVRVAETGAVINTDTLPAVRGDCAQMAHVFQNLLSNSLKYRRAEVRPEIQISAKPDSGYWTIAVRDNGIGFQQQYAERIFGLFKRLHKDAYPGTGLGLAICQRIVERYGGRMWAEGYPGEGAIFYFRLPQAEVQ